MANLPFDVTKEEIRDEFDRFGEIEEVIHELALRRSYHDCATFCRFRSRRVAKVYASSNFETKTMPGAAWMKLTASECVIAR